MQRIRRSQGFTLVEILIVVIILGILAAIVIPQFTNASEDARKSSVTSQLQTIRSQVELYKLQHRDQYPTDTGAKNSPWNWDKLTSKTNENGVVGGGDLGPYLQSTPVNALTKGSKMYTGGTSDTLAQVSQSITTGSSSTVFGFTFSQETGKIWAYNSAGTIHTEN